MFRSESVSGVVCRILTAEAKLISPLSHRGFSSPCFLRGQSLQEWSDAPISSPPNFSGFLDPTQDDRDATLYSRRARPLPLSPSYYSRQPQFNESILNLRALFREYQRLPVLPPSKVGRVAWKSLQDYNRTVGEPVKASDYNRCIEIVKRLYQIHPALMPPAVKEALDEFKRNLNPHLNIPRLLRIDRFGRAVGVGKRKTSVARAWVVEGTGEIIVNGKTIGNMFARIHDRESASWALRATNRIDKYNIWASVNGGGTTGQAEALTLAIAKGLLAHEPALKSALRRGTTEVSLGPGAEN
jgi:small subunit ribosomal protein S9